MKQIIIADSTSISNFLTCPEQYNLARIENLTTSNDIDEDIAAGSYGHKLLEIYYKEKHHGITYAVGQCNKFHLEDDFPLSKEKRDKVADRFKFYWMRYSMNDFDTMMRSVPSITIATSVERNGQIVDCEPYLMDSYVCEPLVEQGFSYLLFESNEYLFVLEGRTDWMASTQGMNMWVDHKFQFRQRDLFKYSIQFRNYSLATGLNLGVINYIRLHEKITDKTLQRDTVSFSPLEMKMWREELIEIFIQMARAAKLSHYEKNRVSCQGMFGYPCAFVNICNEYNKQTREAIKSTQFVQREEWKPW